MATELCLYVPPQARPDRQATVLIIPPLFDEANRMRRTLVLTMQVLSARGHGSLLPDLPGQNDSLVETQDATLTLWRSTLADIALAQSEPVIVASWRGGALIDDAANCAIGWWRMAPQSGSSIVKMLMRARIAGDKAANRTTTIEQLRAMACTGPIALAGNRLSAEMIAELENAQTAAVSPLRTVQTGDGDDRIAGTPLWLRAESGEDAAMAVAMANDISDWARQCAAG